MTTTAKKLFDAQYATTSDATYYTVPASTKTIIDKITATNTDGSACTVNINFVPSGGSVGGDNLVIDAFSIATTVTKDFTELQNHILGAGDFISVKSGTASKLVIRASGREITA